MKYEDWQIGLLDEIHRDILLDHPLARSMHAVRFLSRSAGRGRKRPPRLVTLMQFNGDHNRWRFWSGEDRQDKGRIPWDTWAQELFGPEFSSEFIREEFTQLLNMTGGRF